MRYLVVVAMASAWVAAADPPSRLPDLVLERGESIAYAYPPHDSLTTSDPNVVRVVERGKGLVGLVGTMVGVTDIQLVATVGGAQVVYVGRIEVVLPLAVAITADVRAGHRDVPPVGQQRLAAERLALARDVYRLRAAADSNLYRSFELACEAWSLLEPIGGASAMAVGAAALMDQAKAELDARYAPASSEVQRAIEARDWSALGEKLAAVLRLVPDARDARHQRARRLREFYAELLGARDPDPESDVAREIRMAQFCDALRLGVCEMEEANYRDAGTYLSTAGALQKSATVESLIQLNGALADRPAEHVDLILEITSHVMRLKNDVWLKTGVVPFARALHEKWSLERGNAQSARLGDEQFDRARYREALDHYDRVGRDSELLAVRLGKIEICKTKLTEALRDEAKALIIAAEPERAIVNLTDAMVTAPHEMQVELVNLLRFAESNTKFAVLLRTGREELRNGRLDWARQFLEQIPDTSIYFEDAAETLVAVSIARVERNARQLYALGEGPKVLALLEATSDPSLIALREKVDAVHMVYLQAKALSEAEKYPQANNLWLMLKWLVKDPANQYSRWAEAELKVDPTAIAAEHAKAAQEAFAAGTFLNAARHTSRALHLDATNAIALALRGTFERQVTRHYGIGRPKWAAKAIDDAAFLRSALDQYVLLRAASPMHPLLATMAEDIVRAGGEVPAKEGEPQHK